MPQRWFIRNASTDRLTGRHPHSCGCKYSVGHVTEMTGHVPEFGGHDAETVGHDGPKYALGPRTNSYSPITAFRAVASCLQGTTAWFSACALHSFPFHRWQVGAVALEDLGGHADRFAQRRVRMDGLADVGGLAAHLDGQADLAD